MAEYSSLRFANIFTTPLLTHLWHDAAELNPLLREHIVAHRDGHPGLGKSNQGAGTRKRASSSSAGYPGEN